MKIPALGTALATMALGLTLVSAAPASAADPTWSTPQKLVNAKLSASGDRAIVKDLSCITPGNCILGGVTNWSGNAYNEPFVATESNGVWSSAYTPVADQNFNPRRDGVVTAVGCISGGNCLAGGVIYDPQRRSMPFMLVQTNGTWSRYALTTLVGLNAGGYATISDISCVSTISCTVVGVYATSEFHTIPFSMVWNGMTFLSFPAGTRSTQASAASFTP